MKKRMLGCLIVLSMTIPLAHAGEIFGKVFKDNAPVGEGAVTVELACGTAPPPVAKTDKTGSYHLVAPQTGKCTLTVRQGEQAASLAVASYDEPVQVDLVLETRDGKLAVRRK